MRDSRRAVDRTYPVPEQPVYDTNPRTTAAVPQLGALVCVTRNPRRTLDRKPLAPSNCDRHERARNNMVRHVCLEPAAAEAGAFGCCSSNSEARRVSKRERSPSWERCWTRTQSSWIKAKRPYNLNTKHKRTRGGLQPCGWRSRLNMRTALPIGETSLQF